MNAQTEAFKKKVRAELQQTKTRLMELEAKSKAEDQQVATDLINQLKKTHRELEKKQEEIGTSAVAEMDQEAADIQAGIDKLRSGLAQLDAKLKTPPHRKAG